MAKAPEDIVFDDLGDPKLTRLQKLAINSTKQCTTEFTQDAVLSAASKATGLSDFGPRPFREALQVLLDCFKNDLLLSGIGEQQAFKDLVRYAFNHLIIHDRIKNTLELAATKIVKPMSVS